MFVGLGLHKNYLHATVVDNRGTILREEKIRIPNIDEDIETANNAILLSLTTAHFTSFFVTPRTI